MPPWTLLLLALAAAGDPADQPADPSAVPTVSLARIGSLLAQPRALDLPVADPLLHFHVEVQGRQFYREIAPPRDTRPIPTPALPRSSPGSPALLQVDLLSLGRQAASAVSNVRRARAARAAREEVEDVLREFCADRGCESR